jgi:PP-loop superfamily ATP-utilizing enzyme
MSVIRRKWLTKLAVGIACVAPLTATYLATRSSLEVQIAAREQKISNLSAQVETIRGYLEDEKSSQYDLTLQVANLTKTAETLKLENEELNKLSNTKQYQLMLAWHEIYVLRNQTARLETRVRELQRQIEMLQSTPAPTILP